MTREQIGIDNCTGDKIYIGDTYYSITFEEEDEIFNTPFRPLFLNKNSRDEIKEKLEIFKYRHYSKKADNDDHNKFKTHLDYITTENYNKLITKYLLENKVFISIYTTLTFIKKNFRNNDMLKDFKLLKLIN